MANARIAVYEAPGAYSHHDAPSPTPVSPPAPVETGGNMLGAFAGCVLEWLGATLLTSPLKSTVSAVVWITAILVFTYVLKRGYDTGVAVLHVLYRLFVYGACLIVAIVCLALFAQRFGEQSPSLRGATAPESNDDGPRAPQTASGVYWIAKEAMRLATCHTLLLSFGDTSTLIVTAMSGDAHMTRTIHHTTAACQQSYVCATLFHLLHCAPGGGRDERT